MIDHLITYRINDPEPDRALPRSRAERKLEEAQGVLERGRSICFWGTAAAVAVSYVAGQSDRNNADKAGESEREIAWRQQNMAEDQWNYYKTIYQPVEKSLAEQATQGVQPDYTGVTSRASTDVNNSFDKAAEIGNRNMYRLGLNPNSGNAIAANRMTDIERARTDANAQTNARETERRYVDDLNFNRRLAVAGTGKGLPSSAMYGMASAGAMQGNIASQYGQSAYNTAKFVGGLPWGKVFNSNPGQKAPVTDMSTPYNGGGAYNTGPNDWATGPNGEGLFADGGEIDGPGTGTSDSIPIRASDGEYVIPADVVRRKGTEFFDKLLAKNHAPARGLSFMRPGDQVMDVSARPAPLAGGLPGYANGGQVRAHSKPSYASMRERTRKALANIGL